MPPGFRPKDPKGLEAARHKDLNDTPNYLKGWKYKNGKWMNPNNVQIGQSTVEDSPILRSKSTGDVPNLSRTASGYLRKANRNYYGQPNSKDKNNPPGRGVPAINPNRAKPYIGKKIRSTDDSLIIDKRVVSKKLRRVPRKTGPINGDY